MVEMLPENGLVSVQHVLKDGNLVYLVHPEDAALYRELTKDAAHRLTDAEMRIQVGRTPRRGKAIECHYDAGSRSVVRLAPPIDRSDAVVEDQPSLFDECGLREECLICGKLLPGHEDWCGTPVSFTSWH